MSASEITKVAIEQRFFTAAGGQPPTEEQRFAVQHIGEAVNAIALAITEMTPAITDTLRENLDDPSLYSAGYTYSTEFGARFSLSIEEGSEMGHQLYMRPGDSATVIVDPESRCAIAVFERATSRDTIVLQEGAPRAIGP